MVKLTFLGSCREVGRSGLIVESNNGEKCILDYGVRFKNEERLPLEVDYNKLKAIALTHCHADHSGALPYLYKAHSVPLFTNSISLAITEVLIKDMIRISNYSYPFGYRELDLLKSNAVFLELGSRHRIGDNFYITFINAGHIPGSVSVLLEVDKKNILYTGDINTKDTNLNNHANSSSVPPLDGLIVESTYALKEHPPREILEEKFVEKIIDITENGGTVLVPAFGVSRSQEALLILEKYKYKGKIFLDGLARRISTLYLEYPEFIKDIRALKRVLKKTQFIFKKKDRASVKKSSGVIISPSGMLKGGAAIYYIQSILNDPASAIYLVGYQVEGSPGRALLDSGIFEFDDSKRNRSVLGNSSIKAVCDYDYFDFSSHADGNDLQKFIQDLKFRSKSNKNVFCVHGDNKSTTYLASELVKKDYNSVAPEIGEIYKI